MTTFTHEAPAGTPSLVQTIANTAATIADRVRRYRLERRTRILLSGLSDHQLRDIGLEPNTGLRPGDFMHGYTPVSFGIR